MMSSRYITVLERELHYVEWGPDKPETVVMWHGLARTSRDFDDLAKLVPAVIDDLVGICVTEHRDNNQAPDKIGKRESNYVQCYDKIQLYLLENGQDKIN